MERIYQRLDELNLTEEQLPQNYQKLINQLDARIEDLNETIDKLEADGLTEEQIDEQTAEEDAEIGIITGRYVREEGGAQRYIVINVDGVEEKLLWLYWFDGADNLLADPSFYLNREVYIEYVTFEMFDGISRTYIPVKVLVSLLGNE